MLVIALMAALTALTSCGTANETEKKLDGQWKCDLVIPGAGNGVFVWHLDAADHVMSATISTSLMDLDDCLSLTLNGKWSATPESLTYTIDPDGFEFKVSDAMLSQIEMMGMDKDKFFEEAEQQLRKDFGTGSTLSLSNLTDSTFTVTDTESNLPMDFKRI